MHETVADRDHPWPRSLVFKEGWKPDWPAHRSVPERVVSTETERKAGRWEATQRLVVPGISGEVTVKWTVYDHDDRIHLEAEWMMGQERHPEATYVTFPLNVPGAAARYDIGGLAVDADADRLPGSCADYFTAQRFVDLSGREGGVTIACRENPMFQFGGFRFGEHADRFTLPAPLVLGWVTNNYWEVNFAADQPGLARAWYVLVSHGSASDSVGFAESDAHRLGMEAEQPMLLHPLHEPSAPGASLPETGSLLELPELPLVVTSLVCGQMRPGERRWTARVRLLNASDSATEGRIASGVLRVVSVRQRKVGGATAEPRHGTVTESRPDDEDAFVVSLALRAIAEFEITVEYPR